MVDEDEEQPLPYTTVLPDFVDVGLGHSVA